MADLGLTTAQYDRSQYLRCSTYGHAWFDYDSNWTPMWGTPLTLRCERCGTERRDTIGAAGQVVGRHYDYPTGYKYSKGTRPTRSQFRQMLLAKRIAETRGQRAKQQKATKASAS